VVASFIGSGWTFGGVAALALVLAVAAAATPAATPTEPQALRELFRALTVRKIQIAIWLCLIPALLFGNLGVLAPLRLSQLGSGGTYLVMAAIEAASAPVLGRASDRYGRFLPLRSALLASAIVTAILPWPERAWLLASIVICAGFAFGSYWTPAMSMLTDEAE